VAIPLSSCTGNARPSQVAAGGKAAATPTTATATTATSARRPRHRPDDDDRSPAGVARRRPTAVLAGLRVAPEGPRTGYKRELFPLWIDADHDGCNTREEVLIAESRSRAQVDPYGCTWWPATGTASTTA